MSVLSVWLHECEQNLIKIVDKEKKKENTTIEIMMSNQVINFSNFNEQIERIYGSQRSFWFSQKIVHGKLSLSYVCPSEWPSQKGKNNGKFCKMKKIL